MPQVKVAKDVVSRAYANYLQVLAPGVTIYQHRPDLELAFYNYMGLTKAQWKRSPIKTNKRCAKRIEVLAGPHGYTMLKAFDARKDPKCR